MPIAKKIPLMIPTWIMDVILKHGIAVEKVMPYGALNTLDALEAMIDDLVEIHTNLAHDVHRALESQQPCADLSDGEESNEKTDEEGVALPCQDRRQYLN